MYGIYKVCYYSFLPIPDVVNVFKHLNLEGEPEYQFDNLESAINTLETHYKEIVTKEHYGKGTKYTLCGIVDSFGNVKAVLNLDKVICLV